MDQRHLHGLELPLSIASIRGDEQIWDRRRHLELTKKRFARKSQDDDIARGGMRCALAMHVYTRAGARRQAHAGAQAHAFPGAYETIHFCNAGLREKRKARSTNRGLTRPVQWPHSQYVSTRACARMSFR
jgi:hypothetical protein